MNKTRIIYYLIFVLLVSCHDEDMFIDYIPEGQGAEISFSGLVSNDSIYLVLTETTNREFLSNSNTSKDKITDTSARVILYQDGNYFCELEPKAEVMWDYENFYNNTKCFYAAYKKVKENSIYKIEVDHPKFGVITAETKLRSQANITKVDTTVFIMHETNVDTNLRTTLFTVHFENNLQKDEYYIFDPRVDKDDPAALPSNIHSSGFTIDNFAQDYYYNYLFKDYYLGIEIDQISFSLYEDISDSISIDLLSLSEDYYNYCISVIDYNKALEDPFSKPVSLYSNVSNGYGIWGGYLKTTYKNY